MKNIFVPDIEVCQTLIKKFLGGESGEKYTINVFVLNKEEAIEIINATGTIVTPVQHLNQPCYDNPEVDENDNNDETTTPIKMSRGDRIKQLNGLRVQNLKKAVGRQFTATRSGYSATFTITPELIYLGEDGDVYTAPSGAITSIWEKKGYPGVLAVNGWVEAVDKDGKSLDDVLGVGSHG